ncbi:MAG: serine/threonine protein kinase [Lentisphaeria bacterium]|nr:serine/threonine protein kinase [Lentisphaeria bacterium]
MQEASDFTGLTPDAMLDGVEAAVGKRLMGLAHPHNSYINRVYELQSFTGERLIVKLYRPGRWCREALLDEHRFVLECAAAELPVVAPMRLADGGTLGQVEGVSFAVFPKRWGRPFEVTGEEDWRRIGRVLSRMHAVGCRSGAEHRVVMHPDRSLRSDIEHLRGGGYVTPRERDAFFQTAEAVLESVLPLFEDVGLQRIHGDCHAQNVLDRPGEGLMLIDFDDMAVGPPVQDLWMLLPDRVENCRREMHLLLEGYETFQEFDDRSLRLVEPLRAMRMLYFLAWCSRQLGDPNYKAKFPDWGTEAFWRQQVDDLRRQLACIREARR